MRAITGAAAGAGAAAHSGGDEHHVGAVHRLEDLVERLFGGGASDIRPRAGAEPTGDADPELDLARRGGLRQRLSVGIAGHELAPDQVRADHVVDGVSAGAADPDDGNAGLHLLLVSRDAQIDHAVPLRCNAASSYPVRSGLPSLAQAPAGRATRFEFASKVLAQPVTQSTEEPVRRRRRAAAIARHFGMLRQRKMQQARRRREGRAVRSLQPGP